MLTMNTITIKVWRKTREKLRTLHALTNVSMASIIDILVTQSLEKLGFDEEKYNEFISHSKDEEYEL